MPVRTLLAALWLAAAPAGAVVPITWEEAVAEAARANPSLDSSRLSLKASRQGFWSSLNTLLPSASLSNSWSDSKGASDASRYGASFSASWSMSLSKAAGIAESAASVRQSEAALLSASADLRRDLRGAFARLYFAQQSLEAARVVRDMRLRYADLVSLRYDSGRESKGNLLRAQAQRASALADYASAERGMRVTRRDLLRRLGRENYAEVAATGTLVAQAPPPMPDDFVPLLDLRPEVLSARAAASAARARRLASKSDFLPSLSANYSRSVSGPTEFPNRARTWSAGASLSLPLFGGGPTASVHEAIAASARAGAAERQLAAERQSGLLALEQAWANYADAVQNAEAAEAQLVASRQRNDEADVRYAAGLLSFDVWEPIVSERVSRESSVVSSRRSAIESQAAWERALGRALGE